MVEKSIMVDSDKRTNKNLAIPPLPEEPQCYCKKRVANHDNSVQCLNGESNCPYGGYFHQSCIRKFDYKVEIKAGFKYLCKACKRLGPDVASRMSKLKKDNVARNADGFGKAKK